MAATTGAHTSSWSRTIGWTMSPECKMRSTPSKARRTSSHNTFNSAGIWVSERMPILVKTTNGNRLISSSPATWDTGPAAPGEGAAMGVNGWRVADSDMHLMEPADLWTRYIDPAWRHAAPVGLNELHRDMRVRVKNHNLTRTGPVRANPVD